MRCHRPQALHHYQPAGSLRNQHNKMEVMADIVTAKVNEVAEGMEYVDVEQTGAGKLSSGSTSWPIAFTERIQKKQHSSAPCSALSSTASDMAATPSSSPAASSPTLDAAARTAALMADFRTAAPFVCKTNVHADERKAQSSHNTNKIELRHTAAADATSLNTTGGSHTTEPSTMPSASLSKLIWTMLCCMMEADLPLVGTADCTIGRVDS